MKILFAIKRLENMAGGAERVFLEVAAELKARGHDIYLATFDRAQAQSFYVIPKGTSWTQLNVGNSAQKARPKETLQRINALRQLIKNLQPDAVVAFQHSMFVPASLSCLATGIPVIASEHIVPAHYKDKPHEFFLFFLSTLFVKKMTVLSETIRMMYPKFVRDKMVAITNPVRNISVNEEKRSSSKIILNVGRLDPQKDQATLIEAFKIIHSQYPDWKLRILGEGSCRADLEKKIAELKLQNAVSLPGLSRVIEDEYEAASIFALSSIYESFGLATAEAMGAGLPVIGFEDCPGTNEIIQHEKNGLLVKIDPDQSRAESLADALRTLIESPSLRSTYGNFGKECAQDFKIETVADSWENLLRDVSI